MKFHPTLFSTPMVQALLDDRKTKTRRTKGLEYVNKNLDEWEPAGFGTNPDDENDKALYAYFKIKNTDTWTYVKCPYQVGDVLWVRESFYAYGIWIKKGKTKTGKQKYQFVDHGFIRPSYYRYMDNPPKEIFKDKSSGLGYYKRNSLFMPKPACRIFLKIKSIRVERLQEISEGDATAEGAKDTLKISEFEYMKDLGKWIIPRPFSQHQFGFLSIWCKINGCESWLSNPYVWVYEFERIEKPSNFITQADI